LFWSLCCLVVRLTGTQREGRERVPKIVDAADGCDPGCELGGLPLSGAEVVEIEVGAAQ
jgi:hypothetical protein